MGEMRGPRHETLTRYHKQTQEKTHVQLALLLGGIFGKLHVGLLLLQQLVLEYFNSRLLGLQCVPQHAMLTVLGSLK